MNELFAEVGLVPIPPMCDNNNSNSTMISDVNVLHSESEECEENAPPKKKRRRKWTHKKKNAYENSMFWMDHHNPQCKIPGHRDAANYRLDYRMPWSEADKLISVFKENEWLTVAPILSNGKRSCPLEIKILGTLYWMGSGCTWRTIHNLSGRVFSEQSFRLFGLAFLKIMAEHLAPIHIKKPRTVEELEQINAQYSERGFPGACGSMDGVQIYWEACPYRLKYSFTGKETKPTVGFNCTVDHNLRFLYVGDLFAGRFNDKTKLLYDEYIQELRTGKFKDFAYTMKDKNGNQFTETGPYVINDNGYHYWSQCMCPSKHTAVPHLALLSKHLESTRKDVERTFGIMKKRFRILKFPLLLTDVTDIKNLFLTCATLHKMLLKFDKQFKDNCSPTVAIRNNTEVTDRRARLVYNQNQLLRAETGTETADQTILTDEVADEVVDAEIDQSFGSKRDRLAQHMHFLFRHRKLKW